MPPSAACSGAEWSRGFVEQRLSPVVALRGLGHRRL
jgi:hypothetical protein